MLEKDANEELNTQIEKLLLELSPYLQHFACQQVLEYLIHTYQIYSFNAETLLITFLPFHETKVYARLLRILDFDWSRSKEWQFMKQYLKTETPIPFTSISKATLSSKHSIITCITDHIRKAVDVVGSNFLEIKHPILFNFHAKLLLSTLNDPEKVDEMMLAKLMPFIEHGIKSPMKSFRYTAMVVMSQLVLTVKLKEEVLNSICKLLITKMRPETASVSISTLMVLFQQQNVQSFSKNTLKKLIKHDDEINVWNIVRELAERTDITKFLIILWNELAALSRDSESEEYPRAVEILLKTSNDPTLFTEEQATHFLKLILSEAIAGNFIEKKKMKVNVRAVGLRFAKQFDNVYEELKKKDTKESRKLKIAIDEYQLEDIVQWASETVAAAAAETEEITEVPVAEAAFPEKPKLSAVEKAQLMANSSEFSKRQVFSGDPIKQASKWLKKEDWDKFEWALNEMALRGEKYFSQKVADDVEAFFIEVVRVVAVNKVKAVDMSSVKSAFASVSDIKCAGLYEKVSG